MTGPQENIGRWLEDQRVKITGRVAAFQVEVTPELAKAWLKLNVKNRNPSRPKIGRFARMMKAGKWTLNGESVKFSTSGRLLDGQSRLMAIVQAAVPVVLEVRGGLADRAQESMDTGEARAHRHQLEMLGEKYPNEIAAALRLVHFWEQSGAVVGKSTQGQRDMSNTTIRETLERHPTIRESVGRCLNVRAMVAISMASFFHYLFAMADRKKADQFIERFTTGANLGLTSPIYLLRERFTQDRLSSKKIQKREKMGLIVKAWNAFYAGKTVDKLSFFAAEDFPPIAGMAEKATPAPTSAPVAAAPAVAKVIEVPREVPTPGARRDRRDFLRDRFSKLKAAS